MFEDGSPTRWPIVGGNCPHFYFSSPVKVWRCPGSILFHASLNSLGASPLRDWIFTMISGGRNLSFYSTPNISFKWHLFYSFCSFYLLWCWSLHLRTVFIDFFLLGFFTLYSQLIKTILVIGNLLWNEI